MIRSRDFGISWIAKNELDVTGKGEQKSRGIENLEGIFERVGKKASLKILVDILR